MPEHAFFRHDCAVCVLPLGATQTLPSVRWLVVVTVGIAVSITGITVGITVGTTIDATVGTRVRGCEHSSAASGADAAVCGAAVWGAAEDLGWVYPSGDA